MRKKLTELVHNARMNALWHNAQYPSVYIADMLITDGVTIPVRCKDCKKEWCYLRQELGPDGFCSAGERKDNGNPRDR